MNKIGIMEMISKRNTKLAVIYALFAGMMVFPVPVIVDTAEAIISGKATSTAGPFSNLRWHLWSGAWSSLPEINEKGEIVWNTGGTGWPIPGKENGFVTADVNKTGTMTFWFNSPPFGDNSCLAIPEGGSIQGNCHIPRFGTVVTATYTVSPKVQQNDNKFCDIIDKFASIDQTKIIREKLRC
jgi:hypothetical protein